MQCSEQKKSRKEGRELLLSLSTPCSQGIWLLGASIGGAEEALTISPAWPEVGGDVQHGLPCSWIQRYNVHKLQR